MPKIGLFCGTQTGKTEGIAEMIRATKFVWVSASPSLSYFHRRLLNSLAKVVEIEVWEYYQCLDEGSSIENAVNLLGGYLSNFDTPIHLIGHGIGGTIALEYARICPAKVVSLTLLSVAVQPAIDWHSYYYTQLRSLPLDRDWILRSIATNLFPSTCSSHIHGLVERLERDLVESPSNHSLFRLDMLAEGGVEMPLMICASQDDPVIPAAAASNWRNYLKSADAIWCAATGGHFFHHFHSELVSDRIQQFWQKLHPELVVHQFTSLELN